MGMSVECCDEVQIEVDVNKYVAGVIRGMGTQLFLRSECGLKFTVEITIKPS